MIGVTNEDSAVGRAQWLAQVSEALEDASRVLDRLDRTDERIDVAALQARIHAARREVLAIRLKRSAGFQQLVSEWTESLPWQPTA